MKLHGNLFQKIVTKDNILTAHNHAKKGKGWYIQVKTVEQDIESGGDMLEELRQSLINHTFHTSKYTMTQRKEGNKIRDLYKLPYYPDRIAQWAVIQVIEPIIIHHLISDTYSAIPNRGIHLGLGRVQKAMREDIPGCQYCLKLDAKHFYQSINHEILKDNVRVVSRNLSRQKPLKNTRREAHVHAAANTRHGAGAARRDVGPAL